jgi:GNAT superfamily N-acetyltransferase
MTPVRIRDARADEAAALEDLQRQGVGRALVVDAAQWAAQRGAGSIRVVANPRAVGFYERVGFAATGVDVPTRFGPGREMVLPLDPGP